MKRAHRIIVVALIAVACGPSFQTVYENDARFEHCYALDEGTVNLSLKAACWKDWKDHHTYGQTRDRLEYAQSRYVALASNALPTDEGMMQAAPGEVGERSQLTAPAPTNPFAPPEAMMAVDGGRVEQSPPPMATINMVPPPPPSVASEDAGVTRPPGAACTDDCVHLWNTCKRDRDVSKCDAAYGRCVVQCVR